MKYRVEIETTQSCVLDGASLIMEFPDEWKEFVEEYGDAPYDELEEEFVKDSVFIMGSDVFYPVYDRLVVTNVDTDDTIRVNIER